MKTKTVKLYNIILPIWILIWFPSWLWLILIPANFAIDGLVLWFCERKLHTGNENFLKRNIWKTCLIGFFSDFLGGVFLLGMLFLLGVLDSSIGDALVFNCFTNIFAFLITASSVVLAGIFIYILNKQLFKEQMDLPSAKYIALSLAVITAPYLFFIPISLFV